MARWRVGSAPVWVEITRRWQQTICHSKRKTRRLRTANNKQLWRYVHEIQQHSTIFTPLLLTGRLKETPGDTMCSRCQHLPPFTHPCIFKVMSCWLGSCFQSCHIQRWLRPAFLGITLTFVFGEWHCSHLAYWTKLGVWMHCFRHVRDERAHRAPSLLH